MNKLTKKLILSAVTMMFGIVALGTSTFAWFTLTQQASVATINLDIVGADGVKIGISSTNVDAGEIDAFVDGTALGSGKFFSGFGESIAFTDIEKAIGEEAATQGNSKLDGILLTAVAGYMTTAPSGAQTTELFAPKLMKNNVSAVSGNATANSDFLNFKLWFLVETINKPISPADKLEYEVVPTYAVTSAVTTFTLMSDATMDTTTDPTWEAGDAVTVSAANALRITTLQDFVSAADDEYQVLSSYAPKDSLGTNPTDLGAYLEKEAGGRSHAYYHNTFKDTNSYIGNWTATGIVLPTTTGADNIAMNAMVAKTKVASAATPELPVNFPATIEDFTSSINGTIIGVDYFIYLDGWDADCFDALYTQVLTINMTFDVRLKP